MKFRLLLPFVTTIVIATVFGLRIAAKEQHDKTEASRTLAFGVMAPLTGDFANYGRLIRDGVTLAGEDLKQSGIETRLIFEDACLPAQGVTAAHKLLGRDQVDAVVANYCLITLAAVQPLFDAAKTPLFQTDLVPDSLLRPGSFTLTTNSVVKPEAEQIAELAYRRTNARRAAILYLTTQWGKAFQSSFANRFRELGGNIVAEETTPIGENDFRAALTRVKAANPDVIFFAHLGAMLGNALRQSRQIGLSQPLLTVDSAEEQGVLDVAGDAAEGMLFLSPDVTDSDTTAAVFSKRFLKRFGYEPSILARNSYDATILAGNALTRCRREKSCAREALIHTENYDGASGRFSLTEASGSTRAFVVKSVQNGRFTTEEEPRAN